MGTDRVARAARPRLGCQGGGGGLLALRHEDARALFYVGRVRLEADEDEGIALLERCASLHPPAAPAAQALILQYHLRHGQTERAEKTRDALASAQAWNAAAAQERASFTGGAGLRPPWPPEETLAPIRAAVRGVPGVRDVYLVRRVVVEMAEIPCYFVGVVPEGGWWKFRRSSKGEELREAIITATEWPHSTYFVVGERQHSRLVRRMKKVAGARLSTSPSPDSAKLEDLRAGLIRRRRRRRLSKVALYAGLATVVLLVAWAIEQQERVIKTTPIRELTVAEAADRVRRAQGHTLVLVLYHPTEEEAALLVDLHRWMTPMSRSDAALLTFAVGPRRDAQAFFHDALDLGMPRLAPLWVEPWPSGTLDSTMGTLGIRVGRRWSSPLAVVFDSTGKVVAQWQGQYASGPVIAAANTALAHK